MIAITSLNNGNKNIALLKVFTEDFEKRLCFFLCFIQGFTNEFSDNKAEINKTLRQLDVVD